MNEETKVDVAQYDPRKDTVDLKNYSRNTTFRNTIARLRGVRRDFLTAQLPMNLEDEIGDMLTALIRMMVDIQGRLIHYENKGRGQGKNNSDGEDEIMNPNKDLVGATDQYREDVELLERSVEKDTAIENIEPYFKHLESLISAGRIKKIQDKYYRMR